MTHILQFYVAYPVVAFLATFGIFALIDSIFGDKK